jgi:HAD superfamily hydrolase (TIGR01549 family)
VLHVCGLARTARPRARATTRRTVRHLEDLTLEDGPETRERERHVEGVVFDLDDTLLPQKPWMAAKLALVHDACRDSLPARETFLAEALRLVEEGPRETLFDVLAERLGLDAVTRDRLLHEYREARPTTCELYPDVQATLLGLRRAGYKLGILSDNPPASQRLKLERSGLEPLVDAVVFTREAGGEKPSKGGFAAISERMEIRPAALAMVGDNPYRDLAGALEAGYAIAYLVRRAGSFWSFDPALYDGVLRAPHAVRVLDSLRSLTWFIGRSAAAGQAGSGTSP